MKQTASAPLPTQLQQSKSKLPERQLISQSQLEQMKRLPNPSKQVAMGNFQTSGAIYSTSGKKFANISDWQEDVYQRVEHLRSKFLKELISLQQKITHNIRQHDAVPQQPKTVQTEKIKNVLVVLNQIINHLNVPKSKITSAYERQLDVIEKRILCLLHSLGLKSVSSTQQGKLHPDPHSVQQLAQPQSQTPQVHQHDDQKKPQLQSTNSQSSLTAMQQNMMHSQGNLIISQKGDSVKSMQQVAKGSLQSPASTDRQANANSLLSTRQMNGPQSNVIPPELSSRTPKIMHLKQTWEHHDVLTQKPKQEFQKHKMQQQKQAAKLQAHVKQQNQLNDINSLKVRSGTGFEKPQHQEIAVKDSTVKRGIGVKSGLILHHPSGGQSSVYISQQSNSVASFSTSSPKVSCPQLAQHSPHIVVQNLPTPLTEVGTPLRTANSTSAIPTSSLTQSFMPGSYEKLTSDASSLLNPGMSASPLLEESNNIDGINCKMSTIISDESSVAEQPMQRLINLVNSISSKALSASVSDIGSVVCMTDRMSSSPSGNGSRAAIGEDLVAMDKSHLQERYSTRWSDYSGTRKMKRCINALNLSPLNVSINDSLGQWIDIEKPEFESSATYGTKRPRIEAKHALLEEIREINQQLIDTVVVLSDEDTIPTAAAAATDGGEGTIVKCSFSAVAFSPNYEAQQVSAQMLPIQPLRLLVPTNYPFTSPIFLDKMTLEAREDDDDLSVKVNSKLNMLLRSLPKPWSLREIARMWDSCAQAVFSELAQQNGGGNIISNFGTWENCLSAA